MFGNLLDYFEINQFLSKTAVDTFLATFGKHWASFNCNIWSRCRTALCSNLSDMKISPKSRKLG